MLTTFHRKVSIPTGKKKQERIVDYKYMGGVDTGNYHA